MFDDIRDKLEGWEAPAPEGLWQRIEAAQESTGAQEKRSSGKIRPAIRWITVAAGTAAAAATLLIMLFSPAQDSTDIPLTAEVLTERNQPETAIGTPGAEATTGTEKTDAVNEAAVMKESRPAESTDIQTHTVLNSGGSRLPVRAAGVSLMAAIVRGAALGVGVLGVLGVVLVVIAVPVAGRVRVARIGRVCSILRLAAGLLAVGIEAVDVLIRHGMLLDLVKRHVASLLSSIVVVSVRHRD